MSRALRLALVEPQAPDISLRRQCQLLGMSRSSVYYSRKELLPYDLELRRLIDEEHLRIPAYGSRRMTAYLRRLQHSVNRKRVQRLMRLKAVYPKPRTSRPGKGGGYRDNIFVERLWRSVKYECIYLKVFEDGRHLRRDLKGYFAWCNTHRPHQGAADSSLQQR